MIQRPRWPNRRFYASSSREQAQECEGVQEECEAHEGAEHEGCPHAWGDSAVKCYRPLKAFRTTTGVSFVERRAHDVLGDIELPCGQCIGCRERRAAGWALRCMHESQLWRENCFVTLTYAPGNLPPDGSLEHRDFQLFMKRLRRAGYEARFYMCGEYGPLNLRPHYHANLFNVNFYDRIPKGRSGAGAVFYDSPVLRDLWNLGSVSVQDLTPETASYTARYILKKKLGVDSQYVNADGVILKPEYSAMSLKPGIGAGWYEKYGGTDVFPQDFVILEGRRYPVPKYYDKLLKRSGSVLRDDIEFGRQLAAREVPLPEKSDERRRVSEVVHEARVRNLTRGLE